MGIAKTVPGQPAPQIYINQRWFTVIGVLAQTPLSPDIDRSVLVGWDAARTQLNFAGHPTVIYVKAREDGVDAVRNALAAKRATETTFSALFLGLAAVALLVGGIGVANTMVVSVLELRREIGLRRALGANKGQIRSQFLTESVALSYLGGLAGTVLGVPATVAHATYQGRPPVIPFPAVAGGFGGAVLIGMAAGVHPSIRASRLTPTEALATA